MKPRPLCNKLNEMLEKGLELGIFAAIQPHNVSGPGSRLALDALTPLGMIANHGVGVQEFITLVSEGRFSAVFNNYALLSIQCTFANDGLRSHWYSYIPCPVDPLILSGRPEEEAIAEWIFDRVADAGPDAFRSVGTYRFDYDALLLEDPVEGHPVSHFTFASTECRIPVRAPLSVSRFLSIVFDNFQRSSSTFWLDYAPFLTIEPIEDTITEYEQLLHHLSWRDDY